jgi:hypothetical protein
MNSPILIKMSKNKSGWRPKVLIDDKKKVKRNACMITNGKRSKLVELDPKDLDNRSIDDALEKKALEMIFALEQQDKDILYREVLIFSAIAMASIDQAQFFVPLVQQQAKMKMKQFKGATEKFVEAIQAEALNIKGTNIESLLDILEDATHVTFQKFGDALIHGKMDEFLKMINDFEAKPPEEKKVEAKPKGKNKMKVLK